MGFRLSIPALKLKVVDQRFIDLCKFIGEKSGLDDEDMAAIFSLEKLDFTQVRPSLIKLSVAEGRPIEISEKGPVIEVVGDNQIGKTTALLYLANLLGYDFFDKNNIEFLGDENLVDQGQEIFSKLAKGMKASLEIVAKPHKLSVNAQNGWIEVTVFKGSEKVFFQPFEVGAMSKALMTSFKPYINVYFISKGRNFDRQLLMDICMEMGVYVEKFRERASNLDNILRAKFDSMSRVAAVGEGVDLDARRSQIQNERSQLEVGKQTLAADLAQRKLKLEAVDKLTILLPNVEKKNLFKISKKIYGLKNNYAKLNQRLSILQESRNNRKDAEKTAKSLSDELEILNKDLDEKNSVLKSIDKLVEEATSLIEGKIGEFLDESEAYRVLRILRNNEFEIIRNERASAELDAGKAIEDLYKTAKKWNPSIKITDELGGSMEALQASFESARKIILDRNLVKTITDELFKTLEDKTIASHEKYESLQSEVQTIRGKMTMTQASLDRVKDDRTESQKLEEKNLFEKTKTEIQALKEKIEKLVKERTETKWESEKLLTELEEFALSIRGDDPGSIIFALDWTDEILTLKNQLTLETQEVGSELEIRENQIRELNNEENSIMNILTNPEFEGLSKRRDSIDVFMGITQTLTNVLNDCTCLTEQTGMNEELISLSRHNITPEVNKVINETFKEKCENYFRKVNETDFSIEAIKDFDFIKRVFTCDDRKQNIGSLSGGTASVMTVLSLASRVASTQLGTILLVDEFNDVVGTLRNETYKRLKEKENLSFAFFASPLDKSPLRTQSMDSDG